MARHPEPGSSVSIERRKSGPGPRLLLLGGAISILVFLVVLRIFGGNLYSYPPNPDPQLLPKDSAIICLAGGKRRIETAYSLYADGVGNQLFIVGAGRHATAQGLTRLQGADVAQKISWDRFDRIFVENESRNTIENAFVVKRFLDKNPDIKTVILVTSPYHMRRAEFMINHQLPRNIRIIPYTPPHAEIEQDNWWQTWLGISLTAEEYFKFLLASLIIPRLGYI